MLDNIIKKLPLILASFFSVLAITIMIFLIVIYNNVSNQSKQLKLSIDKDNQKEEEERTNIENVTVGTSYKIKSTLDISDAYKSHDKSKLTDEKDLETLELASDVLDKIIKDDMTDYQKELAVYEWIIKNISFDSGSMVAIPVVASKGDNPYGVLKTKSAVCAGYATTFRLFMQMLDFECMVVHDDELSHSWNIVKLENEWYIVDCTFDSSEKGQNYQHFNVSDAVFAREHQWDMSLFPAANGLKYSYAAQNAKPLKDVYKLPEYIKKASSKKEYRLFYSIDMKVSPVLLTEMISSIQDRVSNFTPEGVLYSLDKKNYLLGVYLTYLTEDADSDNISEKDKNKIDKAVTKQFGDDINSNDDDDEK